MRLLVSRIRHTLTCRARRGTTVADAPDLARPERREYRKYWSDEQSSSARAMARACQSPARDEWGDGRRRPAGCSALRQAQGVPSSSTVRRRSPSTLSVPNGSRSTGRIARCFELRSLVSVMVGGWLIVGQASAVLGQSENDALVAPPDGWSQFRGTAALTGVSAADIPEDLELLWTFDAGESIDSSAAIVDGTVYVGTYLGELIAVDLDTGKPKWRYQASQDAGIGESSPAVGHGLVFVGDLAGVLHAVAIDTGEVIWTFQTEGEIKSSPVVVGEFVLVGSYDGYLYGLSVTDGTLAWKYETLNYVHATPAVADGVAYFGGCDEVFRGVRVADGEEVFNVSAGAYTAASPAVNGSRVYFGTFDNEVLGLDLLSQEVVWRYEHHTRHFPFYSSALSADGKVIIGGRDRMVHAIDEQTGEEVWTFMTGARVDSSPAASNGRVYVGSGDGRLYVLDLETGEKLWEFDTAAPLFASPAIAEGKVVIGSQDGVLYCFG